MRPIVPARIRASFRSHPLRAALGGVALQAMPIDQATEWAESARFFLNAWLGGVVFFGTLLA
ncbi:hypothetical protein [Sphingosinicella sp. BN140058]|uniref:hypothetical protein n=1 Tax=Sphingosinicella sp. BN140058 TaxID=1892855 RepID=UPI0010127627|nr:hypothetical protein [Sphingosinicella sp. BN140058]QAY78557.1 hypothetical protein ETR14_19935 [Sphingosinicella sp. BN140058]